MKRESIAETELIKEWCFEENDARGLNPKQLTLGSNKMAQWKCSKCGNIYEAKILNRGVNKRGGPYCSNRKIKPGFNDLATTNPDLVKEWDFEKNVIKPNEVSRGSREKVWWKCHEGHRYQASIYHRTSGNTACPECNNGRQTSFAEQAVFFYVKKAFPDTISRYKDIFANGMELDIYIPIYKIGIEYDGYHWHKKEKREREIRKYQICQKHGIKLIRIKERAMDDDNYGETADIIMSSGNLEDKKNLSFVIQNLMIELTTFNIKPYSLFPFEVNIDKDEFEIRKYMTKVKNNSFKDLYPEIAKEWDYDKNGPSKPEMFKSGSDAKVYWKCKKCGHEWKTSISHRVEGTGCPNCYRKKNKGENHTGARRVYQYSKEGKFIKEWPCIIDAKNELGINDSNISMCANHKRQTAGGFRWEFVKFDKLALIPKKENKSRLNLNGKAVVQMDDKGNEIARYASMKEAGRALGRDSSSITRVIKGELKKFAGYYWKLDK